MKSIFAAALAAAWLLVAGPALAATTPQQCAAAGSTGIWDSQPGGSGRFLMMLWSDTDGNTQLRRIRWETQDLQASDDPAAFEIISSGTAGLYIGGVGKPASAFDFAAMYDSSLASAEPADFDLNLRGDFATNADAAWLVLTVPGGATWRWAFAPRQQGNATSWVPVSIEMPDNAEANAFRQAFGKASATRLALTTAEGTELASVDATLPTAADWANLQRWRQVFLSTADAPLQRCPVRLPIWFSWEDIYKGRAKFLQQRGSADPTRN